MYIRHLCETCKRILLPMESGKNTSTAVSVRSKRRRKVIFSWGGGYGFTFKYKFISLSALRDWKLNFWVFTSCKWALVRCLNIEMQRKQRPPHHVACMMIVVRVQLNHMQRSHLVVFPRIVNINGQTVEHDLTFDIFWYTARDDRWNPMFQWSSLLK